MQNSIGRLYDAAIGQDDWNAALADVMAGLGADCLVLGYGQPGTGEKPEIFTHGWDDRHLYAAGYSEEDIWDPDVNPGVAAGRYMPLATSIDRRALVSDTMLATSGFLQATVVKNGCPNHRLMVPYRSRSILSGGFFAKKDGREFTTNEVRAIDETLPHLGRALRLRIELDQQRAVSNSLGSVLEDLGKAVFLLDAHSSIIFANAAAEDVLSSGFGVRREIGHVVFPARLDRAIRDIFASGLSSSQLHDLLIKLDPEGPDWRARIYPATGFAALRRTAHAALVVVLEPQDGPAFLPDPQALSNLFGLTRAEVAVAQLVPSGRTKRSIADTLGLSENTVKSHLMNIRSKVGARSVVELSQLLARL